MNDLGLPVPGASHANLGIIVVLAKAERGEGGKTEKERGGGETKGKKREERRRKKGRIRRES